MHVLTGIVLKRVAHLYWVQGYSIVPVGIEILSFYSHCFCKMTNTLYLYTFFATTTRHDSERASAGFRV